MPKIFHRIFTSTIAFIKQYPIPSLFGIAGMILFAVGLISLLASSYTKEEIIFEDENVTSGEASFENTKNGKKEIFIDIEGAVARPGVYKLPQDSRIKDALIAASGLALDADREWVAKNLNLAQKLTDGAKVYVPDKTQSSKLKTQNYAGDNAISSNQININTASASELESLPGIGAVTAGKIVDGRPYGTIEELVSKKVVGNAVFEKIKEKITVY